MKHDLLAEFGPVKAEIDYSAMQEGKIVDGSRAIVRCPTCQRQALPSKSGGGTTFVHKLVEYTKTMSGLPVTEVKDACYVTKPRRQRKGK